MTRWPARWSALLAAVTLVACVDMTTWSDDDGGVSPGDGASRDWPVCTPASTRCAGDQVEVCVPDGTRYRPDKTCTWPEQCMVGACVDSCLTANVTRSYVGCEYFAVDTDNVPDSPPNYSPRDGEYALVVSNAGVSEKAVKVKIYSMASGTETVIAEADVASNYVHVFAIKPPLNVGGTSRSRNALRLRSDGPVTVYQFNPLNNTDKAYSNDASLLLPVTALGQEYIVTTGDAVEVGEASNSGKLHNSGAFVTVVATADNTSVTVTPTADLVAGVGLSSGGKNPVTVTLNKYETLNIESDTPSSSSGIIPKKGQANLSGTRVKADKPVAVFGGNVCGTYPLEVGAAGRYKCCCDHMEEQFFPLLAWGKEYVAAGVKSRHKSRRETSHFRLTGGAAGIQLTYAPSTPAGAPATLEAGQSVAFSASIDFIVKATGPVLLTQFISSADDVGITGYGSYCNTNADCQNLGYLASCIVQSKVCYPAGDPAMILVPPAEQFRDKYVFLTPKDYYYDFATFIAPTDAKVTLDGKDIGTLTPVGTIGAVQYGVAHVSLTDGKHSVSSDKKVGVIVHGYDSFVSYGYPAGLELRKINPID